MGTGVIDCLSGKKMGTTLYITVARDRAGNLSEACDEQTFKLFLVAHADLKLSTNDWIISHGKCSFLKAESRQQCPLSICEEIDASVWQAARPITQERDSCCKQCASSWQLRHHESATMVVQRDCPVPSPKTKGTDLPNDGITFFRGRESLPNVSSLSRVNSTQGRGELN